MIAPDRHWQDAGRMIGAMKLRSNNHVLLQENLATYLAQMPPEFGDRLDYSSTYNLVFSLRRGYGSNQRWTDKLIRDVEHPYTDSQVLRHVQILQEELGRQTSEI